MPKVSVILPAYNGEKFIAGAIDSILSQTYKDYELIVTNDGSTDRTSEILARFAGKIRVISQQNSGIAKARNVAIENSSGEYIAFLDQDDIWLPEKLEKQISIMEKNKAIGITYTDAYVMYDDKVKLRAFSLRTPHRGMMIEELFLDNFTMTSSVIVRKECFAKSGLFVQALSPCLDYDIWLKVAAHYEADYVDVPLIKFRDHVSTFRKNKIVTAQKLIDTLRAFAESHPDVMKALGGRAGRRMASCYAMLGNAYLCNGEIGKAFSAYGAALRSSGSFIQIFNTLFFICKELVMEFLRSIKSMLVKR